jgi:hypothetical protein
MALAVAGGAGLALRHLVAIRADARAWRRRVERRLANLADVDRLDVLALIERDVSRVGLRGEAGLSYRLTAGATSILFDCGLGTGDAKTALAENAAALGFDLGAVDAIVISHRHRDHVRGTRQAARRTFAIARSPLTRTVFPPTSRPRCGMTGHGSSSSTSRW